MVARNMNISDYENMGVGQVIDILKELNDLNNPNEEEISIAEDPQVLINMLMR